MPEAKQFPPKPTVQTATLTLDTNNTTKTDEVVLYGTTPVAFSTPAALTSTSVTFEGSITGSGENATFLPIKSYTGVAIGFTVAADSVYTLDPADFVAYDSIKIVTGDTEAADREFKLKVISV